jgi:hypothetical protein
VLISETAVCRTFGIRKKDYRIEKLEYSLQRKILGTRFKEHR